MITSLRNKVGQKNAYLYIKLISEEPRGRKRNGLNRWSIVFSSTNVYYIFTYTKNLSVYILEVVYERLTLEWSIAL